MKVELSSDGAIGISDPPCMAPISRPTAAPSVGLFLRKSVVDAKNVVLAVLEPRGLPHVSQGGNVVVPLDTRHVVVVLERHTLALQVGDGRVDVVDMPLSERVTGLSRESV